MAQANRNLVLYGTEEQPVVGELLTAGPVTVELEAGALRHIKYRGIEVIRGIAFLVRNVNWGTYAPDISDLQIEQADGGFRVTYGAQCTDEKQAFSYQATITGGQDGRLSFDVVGAPDTDFATNRLGFVVLHPLVGVAGEKLTVTHTDGTTEETAFPRHISPSQPVFDIRALSHQVCPGVAAVCTMEGDAYEMEDQRNWTDASYKTYVRPLSKPFPYTVPADESVRQSVTLAFVGSPTASVATVGAAPIEVTLGGPTGRHMPRIGLALTPDIAEESARAADRAGAVGAQLILCQLDMCFGDTGALASYAETAAKTGCEVALELIVPDDTEPAASVSAAAKAVRGAGLAVNAVAVSPAAYLMSYQPDAAWPVLPPLEAYYDAVRQCFPEAQVGGGMLSYFTELNRKRPPADAIDYVTHTTCPIVHDADDRSVMETLEALPFVIASTRAFAGDKRYWVGPSTIGMRQNPYGAAPAENPGNGRVAMASTDPRHCGLFGAAWSLGYAAEMIRGGIDTLTLASPFGTFGLMPDGAASEVCPLYHIVRAIAAAAGRRVRDLQISDRTQVQGFAYDAPAGVEVFLANLWSEPRSVSVDGLPAGATSCILSPASVPSNDGQDPLSDDGQAVQNSIELDAFSVTAIRSS